MTRFLGIDYGEKRTGIAISDPLGIIARSLKYIDTDDSLLTAIDQVIAENSIDEIVVGMPINMNGTMGQTAQKVQTFTENLRNHVTIPVTTHDERLTTMQAERFLISADVSRKKRKTVIDSMAAQLLLQSYLDRIRQ